MRALFGDLVARRRLSVSLEMQTVRADGSVIDLDVVAANHLTTPSAGSSSTSGTSPAASSWSSGSARQDRRQATLIDSLADGVMMVDAAGTVVRVNEAFEVMFEAPRVRVARPAPRDLLSRAQARGIGCGGRGGRARSKRPTTRSWPASGAGVGPSGVVLGLRATPADRRCGSVSTSSPWSGADGQDHGGRRLVQRHHRGRARPPPSCARRSSSCRCCWTPSKRASWPATPRAGSPCSTRLPAGSTALPEESDPIGRIPSDRGLRRADGSPMDPGRTP